MIADIKNTFYDYLARAAPIGSVVYAGGKSNPFFDRKLNPARQTAGRGILYIVDDGKRLRRRRIRGGNRVIKRSIVRSRIGNTRSGRLGGKPVNAIALGCLRSNEIDFLSIRKIIPKNTIVFIFAISTLHINNAVFDF